MMRYGFEWFLFLNLSFNFILFFHSSFFIISVVWFVSGIVLTKCIFLYFSPTITIILSSRRRNLFKATRVFNRKPISCFTPVFPSFSIQVPELNTILRADEIAIILFFFLLVLVLISVWICTPVAPRICIIRYIYISVVPNRLHLLMSTSFDVPVVHLIENTFNHRWIHALHNYSYHFI